jgi:hypothetical protein
VAVEDVPEGTRSVTVTRAQERREFLTRGFVEVDVTADLFVRDFEMPYDSAVTYTATARDAGGSPLGKATVRPKALQSTRQSTVTMHDPLRPAKSITLALGRNAINGGQRELGGGAIPMASRSVPISVSSVRGGWTDLPLDVVTYQDAEAEALDAMLGGYDDEQGSGVICFRVSGNIPSLIPRTFFGRVNRPEPAYWPGGDGNGNPRAEWALRATEVQPPSPALVEPVVRWADWQAWFDQNYGWQGFERAFPTWSAANRSLIPLGWADRPAPRYASWADWEAWLRDHGGWPGFNAAFSSWDEAMRAEEPIGWASR